MTPVWFQWDGESLWISAFVSTRKVKDIQRNRRIAVLIDLDRVEGQPDRSVLLEGACELIADPAVVAPRSLSIYTHYMGEEGVQAKEPQSWAVDPENRIIRLVPEKVFAWGMGE